MGERKITVCDKCLQATCWYGMFMCDEATSAGITTRTESELRELGREHPSYWTPEAVEKYTGVKGEVAEIVKVVLSGQDQIDQLNADCARLRALLGEALVTLRRAEMSACVAGHPSVESDCEALAARIAKEVEDGK